MALALMLPCKQCYNPMAGNHLYRLEGGEQAESAARQRFMQLKQATEMENMRLVKAVRGQSFKKVVT